MPKAKRTKRNKYQLLVSAKSSHCKGRTSTKTLNQKKKAYIDDAIKKGKTKAEATKIANKVTKGKCAVAAVSGTKRKKRKTTTRRKRR